MRLNTMALGLFFVALALTFLGLTLNFPAFPGQKYGPALFPRLLGLGIMLCGALLIWRGWQERVSAGRQALVSVDSAFRTPGKLISFLLIPGSIVGYLLLADVLGFVPTAFALLLGLFLWFRARPLTALIVALGMTGAMHWFFGTMMRVPLPRGLFMQLLVGG